MKTISVGDAEELIDYESTIDTMVQGLIGEHLSRTTSCLFKNALESMQKDMEKRGIIGKWTSDYDENKPIREIK